MEKQVVMTGYAGGGTSMIAGIVSNLGVDIGERLNRPLDKNLQVGYGEDRDFRDITCKALAYSNNGVDIREDRLDDEKIERLISSRQGLWGWKDPGTILVMEHYMPYLSNPHIILSVRDKEKVIKRIMKKSFPLSAAKDIYYAYDAAILRFQGKYNEPSMKVQYQEAISKPEEAVYSIAEFLEIEPNQSAIDFIRR